MTRIKRRPPIFLDAHERAQRHKERLEERANRVYGKDREKILKPKSAEPIVEEPVPVTYTITLTVTMEPRMPVAETIYQCLVSRTGISECEIVKVEALNDKS